MTKEEIFGGLIEDLKVLKKNWIERAEQNETHDEMIFEGRIDQIQECIDLVIQHQEYATQEKQGWVKTSERLPEVGQFVLTYSPDFDMVSRDQYRYFEQLDKNDFCYKGVTHWQELPQKPEV